MFITKYLTIVENNKIALKCGYWLAKAAFQLTAPVDLTFDLNVTHAKLLIIANQGSLGIFKIERSIKSTDFQFKYVKGFTVCVLFDLFYYLYWYLLNLYPIFEYFMKLDLYLQ